MKTWQTLGLLGLALYSLSGTAEESKSANQLPTDERAFVDSVGKLSKAQIVELLGEPAKADDVRLKDSGRVVASVWHYHFINTNDSGSYYETTELDFLDDKVHMVVFLNNDGSDTSKNNQYEVPDVRPDL
ncbi:MAG: hypothetical protein SFU55_06685 [Methylophilus sp.]|nr:hypothetical protein [Methylophilus sp.]